MSWKRACLRSAQFLFRFVLVLSLSVGCALQLHAAGDLNGRWIVDLKASDSSEAMLKRLGVGWIQRKFAASTKIEATYWLSPGLLTISSRGPAFSRIEEIRLDGKPENLNESLTGPYTVVSRWEPAQNRVTSINSFKTRDGKPAELTVVRELSDGGATLVLTQTLIIDGETWVVRRVWRRA